MGIGNGEPVSEKVICLIGKVSPIFNLSAASWQAETVKALLLD